MSRGTPEQRAREAIDVALTAAGWVLQDRDEMNLSASRGVAVREFKMTTGHGFVDYMLFVDGRGVGVFEAKAAGFLLTGVELQARRYADGLPAGLNPPVVPLPFVYVGTGAETRFCNLLDPEPRSRRVFEVHRPDTLAEWLDFPSVADWSASWQPATRAADASPPGGQYGARPSSLRARLQAMPPTNIPGLWPNQLRAVENLEESLAADRRRSLIQMATGSGKTKLAVTSIYRLIKFGGARRILFLVDRTNLGEQAEDEFAGYETYDDHRKLKNLYNVQRLTTNTIGSSSKVVITTIQRLYAMLRGEAELPPEAEDDPATAAARLAVPPPAPVVYNAGIPPEYFDVIYIDECHRSIYTLWRQVIEYFDAYLVGLTATPAAHTYGFFEKNVVMEYPHEEAVADGVNVDFDVYRIQTQITQQGSAILPSELPIKGLRDRRTHVTRWERPDTAVTYSGQDLDRAVVARDQIRTIARAIRDQVLPKMFPERREVPKTIIFAKDDSHAEDIVDTLRNEFGKGDDFCQKITYRSTSKKPRDLVADFRNQFNPRIAVTVDLIATGTDIKPVEMVVFMRSVGSRVLFEQMKGRGVRVIEKDKLRAVTPDADAKTRFVVVDCVGVTENDLADTSPLDRNESVAFKALLEHVAAGGTDPDLLSSLASRLARLDRRLDPDEVQRLREAAGGVSLSDIAGAIVRGLEPDRQADEARRAAGLPAGAEPDEKQLGVAAQTLLKQATAPLATKPAFRRLIQDIKAQHEQIIDEVSEDRLVTSDLSPEARDKARALVRSFEQYLAEHKDDLDALQFFYAQPYAKRLHFKDVKALADAIKAPPRQWTPDAIWRAYEMLEKDRVRGAAGKRMLTDLVSLVRHVVHPDEVLVPFADRVRERFAGWMQQQANQGRRFTPEQLRWLEMIRDHVAETVEIDVDDFNYAPFVQAGGLGKAAEVFGGEVEPLLRELNGVLAA